MSECERVSCGAAPSMRRAVANWSQPTKLHYTPTERTTYVMYDIAASMHAHARYPRTPIMIIIIILPSISIAVFMINIIAVRDWDSHADAPNVQCSFVYQRHLAVIGFNTIKLITANWLFDGVTTSNPTSEMPDVGFR